MAPTDQKMKSKKFTARDGNRKKSRNNTQAVKKKRKWVPETKIFEGNLKEGQGFAFKRKEKVKHEYNKLLRKEKKKNNPETKALYKDEYPEHLRHLYMAEAEKLKNEAWTNRINRSKLRMKGHEKEEETGENDAAAHQSEAADPDPDATGESEPTDSVSGKPEPTAASEKESLPMSNRMRKKMLKKTSYQKTKEEFESVKEKRRKKERGVPAEQAAERRSHPEVQTEKDGDVSDAEQKDQERTAQPEPPDGVFASKDPRT